MKKGNVLVIGNSGVGKSTLINAVLGNDVAKTSWGTQGTTKEIHIYDGEPFNIIDTIGFEPSPFKTNKAITSVKRWSKKCTKEENEDKQINVIWFCVDGTSSKLFPKSIKDLSKATSMWKSVPIIVVITKSYSVPDRAINVELVKSAFNKNKKLSEKIKFIIPVVASTYVLNYTASATPEGITELITCTNDIMPEGLKAAQKDIAQFTLNRKRAFAQGVIATSVATSVAKCFVTAGSTAIVLASIENMMVDSLSALYSIDSKSDTVLLYKNNIANGNINKMAKQAIATIEMLPIGKKLGKKIINPLISACVVIIIGETASLAFEKIYLDRDEDHPTFNKIKEFFESDFATQIVEQAKTISIYLTEKSSPKEIINVTTTYFDKKKFQ